MKYGLLTILRTPVKTLLFLLLIAAVTGFLSLGVGMWQSAEHMLDEADRTFTTAGEFVFTGGGYPDATGYDAALADAAAAFDTAAPDGGEVLFSERQVTYRAYLPDYRWTGKPLGDYAVLLVSAHGYEARFDAYGAVVEDARYSADALTGKYVYLNRSDTYDIEPGHRYAIFGRVAYIPGQSFRQVEAVPSDALPFVNLFGGSVSIVDITDYPSLQAFLDSDDSVHFRRLGETLAVLNHSVDVVPTGDAEVVYGFHSGEYKLTDGAFFSLDTDDVCIVPQQLAAQFGLSVGDTLALPFHHPSGRAGRYFSYRAETGFATEARAFTIVGIYQVDSISAPVFIPDTARNRLEHSVVDYVLARVSLDNRRADRYIERIRAVLPVGVDFKVYDQGYKAAVMSINSLRETAILMTGLCLALCALVLWFFGFLFIGRSERSAMTLLALGTGKRRVMLYFLSGGGVTAGLAAALGALIGCLVSNRIFGAVYQSIAAGSVYDFRYSIIGYGVSSEQFSAAPVTNPLVYLLMAAGVTLIALLLCAFFALRAVQRQDPRRKFAQRKKAESAVKPAVPRRAIGGRLALALPSPALRYSVKSVLRGGKRSLTVPVLFVAMLLFLCLFHSMQSGFQARLDRVYDDVPVTLRFSDISGKKLDNLVIRSTDTDRVKETGFTAAEWASCNALFKFNGITQHADGTRPDTPPPVFEMPGSAFARETIINQWKLTADSNVFFVLDNGEAAFAAAPEFAYTEVPDITWADGLGADDFFRDYGEMRYFIVSEHFLEQRGVSLGDSISSVHIRDADQFISGYGGSYFTSETIIAGAYPDTNGRATVYCYLPGAQPGLYEATGYGPPKRLYNIYHSAGFLLKDTDRLSALKDALESFIDPLGRGGRSRVWAIIDDAALYSTVDSLNRYIGFMNLLYPILMAMVVGIGFLVSHLLLKGRAGEIAILRGLGASKRTVFFSFFNEQLLLSLLGGAVGMTAAALTLGGVHAISPIHVVLPAVCYYAGLSLAIFHTYQTAAIAAIAEKEA